MVRIGIGKVKEYLEFEREQTTWKYSMRRSLSGPLRDLQRRLDVSKRGSKKIPSWIRRRDGFMNISAMSSPEERLHRRVKLSIKCDVCGRGDLGWNQRPY